MMRLCDVRRRRRLGKAASMADDRELQRRVLRLALDAHPLALDFDTLASRLSVELSCLGETIAMATAVRDLVLVGLLGSDGLRVLPTRAALTFARLELIR